MFTGRLGDYGCLEIHQADAMGLPIATLSRLVDRKHLPVLPAGAGWRLIASALLLVLVLPVLVTAAVATIPVLLTVGLAVALRRVWQWRAQRRLAGRDPR